MISLRVRLAVLLVAASSAAAIGAAQRQTRAPQPAVQSPPMIRAIEPSRVTAGQNFRITVQIPDRYQSGIRLAVRRLSHQAAAKYESAVIIDNRPPGDVNPETGIIEHVIRTDEGWLPVTAVASPRRLDVSRERYIVGLDSGFEEMNVVTVTGGADDGALANVIDGNLDTLSKAVREWIRIRNRPQVANLTVVEIDGASAVATTDHTKFLAWGEAAAGRSGASGPVHHFVLEQAPDTGKPGALADFQKGALMMSTRELENALAVLPKESISGRAAAVQKLKDALSESATSTAK